MPSQASESYAVNQQKASRANVQFEIQPASSINRNAFPKAHPVERLTMLINADGCRTTA
jgi:hypothetical protein